MFPNTEVQAGPSKTFTDPPPPNVCCAAHPAFVIGLHPDETPASDQTGKWEPNHDRVGMIWQIVFFLREGMVFFEKS